MKIENKTISSRIDNR